MNTNWKPTFRCASATLFAGFVLAGCASGPPAHSEQLHQQIESASTVADHSALAAYYDREAARAQASSAEHRARALKYPASNGPRGPASLRAHCNSIAQSFDTIASVYVTLAADHRAMAGQAKP